MASASVLTASWNDDYPEFRDMMAQYLGELEYVDEYDVPFWKNISHVSIKPHVHPLFSKEAQSTLLIENAHQMSKEHERIIQETFDFFNKERLFWLDEGISEEWKEPLAKSPIRLPKALYNQFKVSVHAVGNSK